MANDVVILNNGLERRTRKSGKQHYTVSIESEPLIHNFDAKRLGRGPAEAIAQHLRERIKGITAIASKATLRARETALRAIHHTHRTRSEAMAPKMESYGPAKPQVYGPKRYNPKNPNGEWALQRYSGGRMGLMNPNQSNRAFNDSGRMAESITANAREDAWTVNVAANRFDPTTTKGEAGLERIIGRLVQLVPEFGNPEMLMDSAPVRNAVVASINDLIVKAKATRDQLEERRVSALLGLVRGGLSALRSMAG